MQLRSIAGRVSLWFNREGADARREDPDAPAEGEREPRTAFVLLGGGARGAAQAGALTVLLDAGIRPDFIVGVSAGSWNGSYIALDPTPERAVRLEGLWIATTSNDIMGPNRWVSALNAVANRTSLYGSAGMRRTAERQMSGISFEELTIPLAIVAADLVSGQPVFFTEGPVLPAVLASSAVPGIFPPVVEDGSVLVDGGLVEWAGCMRALEQGAERIFLVACGGVTAVTTPRLDSFRQILERSFEVSNRSSFARTIFALRGAGVEVIPVFPELTVGTALDFDHAPALVHAGRAAARRALLEWKSGDALVAAAPAPVRVTAS